MFLLFADDEVADEVAGIVGRNHASLFGAYTRHAAALARHVRFFLFQLVELNGASVCRLAVDEPIGGRLYPIVATQHAVVVDERRRYDEVRFQIGILAPRVLHDKPQAALLSNGEHLDGESVEVGTFLVALQDCVGLLLDGHTSVVDTAPSEVHLRWCAKVDARKESHDEIVLRDVVPQAWLSVVCVLNRLEEVIRVVGLSEVVLNVVVLGRDAQLDELSLKRARLLKEAMHLSFNLHILSL